jgi:Ca-activated chloride channel family protein
MGLAFFIIAMTRPQYGTEESDIPQTGRDVFIAVDCSKSMLCDDMTPNRLTRAKLAAQDLLDKLRGDRVGLVAFAGRAFLQAPLTTDHDAVRESIQALDYTTIPRGGSSLASAIELVLQTVEKMPGQHHGMILFTDGQETDEGTIKAAKDAAEKHLLILPVGMGTAEGSLIPDPDPEHHGDYLRDARGNVIKTHLESALLQEVAVITGGHYLELASQPLSQSVVDNLTAQLDRQTTDSRHESRPIERYQWPLGGGIVCFILSLFMRPFSRRTIKPPALPVDPQATVHAPRAATAAVATALALLIAAPLHAAPYDAVQQAQDEYASGRIDQARESYRQLLAQKDSPFDKADLAYGLGAADRRLKDYEGAVRAFSDALRSQNATTQQQALRGLASSLYDMGEQRLLRDPDSTVKAWTDSLDHFDTDLKRLKRDSAEYQEVKENRDFVQKRLDELKKLQEQRKQQKNGKNEKQQQKQKGSGEGEEEEDEDGKGGQPQDKDNEGKESKKQHDALQKPQDQLPNGQLRAAENSEGQKQQQPPKEQPGDGDQKKDPHAFSEEEARNQLRNYADDQKVPGSLQYLMRRGEPPAGGKDY